MIFENLQFEERGISPISIRTCFLIGNELIYTYELRGNPETREIIAKVSASADIETRKKVISEMIAESCNRDVAEIKKRQGGY